MRIRKRDVSAAERKAVGKVASLIRQAQRKRITAGRYVLSGSLRRDFWKRRRFQRGPGYVQLNLETVGRASRYAAPIFRDIQRQQGPVLETLGLKQAINTALDELAAVRAAYVAQQASQGLRTARSGRGRLLFRTRHGVRR